MNETKRFVDEEYAGRRYERDGRAGLVVDFGAGAEGSVDLVGDTAIVVVGDDQYEFEVPAGVTTRASMNNGVLTVEVEPAAEDGSDDTDSDSGSETEVQN
jgi:hypothetical protein